MSRSPVQEGVVKILAIAAVVAVVAGTGVASAVAEPRGPSARVMVAAAPGDDTVIPRFLLRSSAQTSDSGQTISTPGYNTSGWLPVSARSTVFAGQLENGLFPDPFFSTNMRNVPTSAYNVPWWFRADITLPDDGLRTYLNLTGVISRADVFVNGTQLANSTQIYGAYTQHELDITAVARTGVNSIAIRVHPNEPNRDLTMGWIDWLQTPPDKNMGIVRDVIVHRGGPVALRDTHVVSQLNAGRTQAMVTVKAQVRNDSSAAVYATLNGTVAGQAISQTLSLAARESRNIAFPAVTVTNAQLWWPAGMGAQFLYGLDLTAAVNGGPSDTAHENFGLRDVTATNDASGHRRYSINGRPILIKGGGYSPDLFLRPNARFVEDKLRAVLDMGLNTVRLEGHIEGSEFFDLTDRMGILTLPGWECCDKWEGEVNGGEAGDRWTAEDFVTAKSSMSAEAKRLRGHPSVISFLIGSDFAPNATQERNYLDALTAADWPNPVIPAAAARSTPVIGASGMKMNGPYDWIPPNYWYNKDSRGGAAWGFASEVSAGPDVPTMDTLRRMMTTSELNTLWQNFNAVQYHRSQSSTFNTLRIFDNALVGRYGAVSSLDDYVRKAQLAQYENVRAQFEAFNRNFTDSSNPANGVIYWMLNSGWTSLHWQLFDTFLDQNGAYYGAKKAGEPLHVQYSYDNRSVVVVNSRPGAASGLTVKVDLFNPDGTNRFSQTATNLSAPGGGGRVTALTIPASVTGLSTTYLARLLLTDAAGTEVSRNVYWLSTAPDVINWGGHQWYFTPTSAFADLKGLNGMAQATIGATASTTTVGDTSTTTVTLRNTSTGRQAAMYLDAHVMGGSAPALPISWTDNAVTLWPGESKTITATYRTADLRGNVPTVRISGWNTATVTIPAGGGGNPEPPPAPVNLRTTSVTASSVGLAWDPGAGTVEIAGYVVERDGNPVGTPTGTTFTDTTVSGGTAYTYRVLARDLAGNVSQPSAALTVTTPGSSRVEAENATISQGLVESNHAGFSGTGFVNYDNVVGSFVEFTVNAAAAGPAAVRIRYANGTAVNRPMDILVNGTTAAAGVTFPGTGAWPTWATNTLTLNLQAGPNTIRARATTANGGPNVDYLEVG
jgi:exo-1,4-beta-D-glucosaminidase